MKTRNITRVVALTILAISVAASSASAQLATPTKFIRSWVQPPPPPKAFDYFQSVDEGSSIVNRYLLAHLSMNIYNTAGVSNSAFEQHLQVTYGNNGVTDVQLFHDSYSGADGAIFVTDDAVIVVFRGTSQDPDGSLADHFADLDNRVKLVKINDKEVGVHQGFWEASGSVYNEILLRVLYEMAQGKELWLTGHSLGGAMAAVTSFRLQYVSGIPVQGVMTFGSPRVGDDMYYKQAEKAAAGGRALTKSTQRFVLDGDPGPTFWNNGWDNMKRKHAYHHYGVTHTIFKSYGLYDFDYNSGELQMAWIPPHQIISRLSTGIHMEYETALWQETSELLLNSGQNAILNALFDLP